MNDACKFFLDAKKKSGYKINDLVLKTGVSKSSFIAYGSNPNSLLSMSYEHCVAIFKLLNISVENFYNTFFPYKSALNYEVCRWKEQHPIDYSFSSQKNKLRSRIMKRKSRESIAEEDFVYINELYDVFFNDKNVIMHFKQGDDTLTQQQYQEYVVPILYNLKKSNKCILKGPMRVIIEYLYRTEYSIKDISELSGINYETLVLYATGKRDFNKIHILTVLKICYILGIDFNELEYIS